AEARAGAPSANHVEDERERQKDAGKEFFGERILWVPPDVLVLMDMRASVTTIPGDDARAAFDRLLAELRPKLHRYCARMTGSVVDGEDVLQDAMIKAIEAFPSAGTLDNPEGWIFRIAHNAALDFIRRRARLEAAHSDEDVTMVAAPTVVQDERIAVAASLRTFMQLPVSQRSSVILKDVLGYSIEEIVGVLDGATIPSVKAALHRGRERLRELSAEPEMPRAPALSERERTL